MSRWDRSFLGWLAAESRSSEDIGKWGCPIFFSLGSFRPATRLCLDGRKGLILLVAPSVGRISGPAGACRARRGLKNVEGGPTNKMTTLVPG